MLKLISFSRFSLSLFIDLLGFLYRVLYGVLRLINDPEYIIHADYMYRYIYGARTVWPRIVWPGQFGQDSLAMDILAKIFGWGGQFGRIYNINLYHKGICYEWHYITLIYKKIHSNIYQKWPHSDQVVSRTL